MGKRKEGDGAGEGRESGEEGFGSVRDSEPLLRVRKADWKVREGRPPSSSLTPAERYCVGKVENRGSSDLWDFGSGGHIPSPSLFPHL